MKPIQRIESWVFDAPPLLTRQKLALGFSATFCLLSTAVCAPMGGSGAQSLFKTQSPAAYWPFFFASPLMILLLCGRALLLKAKTSSAIPNPEFEKMMQPPPNWAWKMLTGSLFLLLCVLGSSINAYNTMQYIPFGFAVVCVVPALLVPGFVMVPALLEYHRKVFYGLQYVFRGKAWREQQEQTLQSRLAQAKRHYHQLPESVRQHVDGVFSHPFKMNRLPLLFNPLQGLEESAEFVPRSRFAYAAGFIGLVIGTLSEMYAFSFSRQIASVVDDVSAVSFAIAVAYVRIGIAAVATYDVFSDFIDNIFVSIKTRQTSMTKKQVLAHFGLIFLSAAAALPNVENQIQTMGHDNVFQQVLAISAMIAPACVFYWGGRLVYNDFLYRSPGVSYTNAQDRLFHGYSSLKGKYRHEIEVCYQDSVLV